MDGEDFSLKHCPVSLARRSCGRVLDFSASDKRETVLDKTGIPRYNYPSWAHDHQQKLSIGNVPAEGHKFLVVKNLALCGRNSCALREPFLRPISIRFLPTCLSITTIICTAVTASETPLRGHGLLDRSHQLIRQLGLVELYQPVGHAGVAISFTAWQALPRQVDTA